MSKCANFAALDSSAPPTGSPKLNPIQTLNSTEHSPNLNPNPKFNFLLTVWWQLSQLRLGSFSKLLPMPRRSGCKVQYVPMLFSEQFQMQHNAARIFFTLRHAKRRRQEATSKIIYGIHGQGHSQYAASRRVVCHLLFGLDTNPPRPTLPPCTVSLWVLPMLIEVVCTKKRIQKKKYRGRGSKKTELLALSHVYGQT